MSEYDVKRKAAARTAGHSRPLPTQEMTSGIPNSMLSDVFAGKKSATSDMMGRRSNLAPSIAAKMSQAFGMDVSGVQVYRSDAMSGSGMQGMASGNKIVLGSDVDLNTMEGQAILGHELSHIRAQSMGIGTGNSGLLQNAALEQQADSEGMMAARGMNISGESMGMNMGFGMAGVENLTPLSGGMSASAGAPMQAKKPPKEGETQAFSPKETISKKPMAPKTVPKPAKKKPASKDWKTLSVDEDDYNREGAYKEIAKQHWEKTTNPQRKAYQDYIHTSGPTNSYLRGAEDSPEQVKQQVRDMDEGMQTTGGDVTAYRGVSDFALISAIKQNKELADELINEKGMIDYDKLNANPDILNGLEFSDDGFTSTSTSEWFANHWREGILDWDALVKNRAAAEKLIQEDLKGLEDSQNANANKTLDKINTWLQKIHKMPFLAKSQGISADGLPKEIHSLEEFNNLSVPAKAFILQTLSSDFKNDGRMVTETSETLQNKGYGSHLYEINVPQGTEGTMIDRMNEDTLGEENNQYELLLGRGMRYKITGLKQMMDRNNVPLKNQFRIMMDVVGQKKKALE